MTDEWEHPTRLQVSSKPFRPSSRRSRSAWQMNDPRHSDSIIGNGPGRLKGPHRRYSSVADASEATFLTAEHAKWKPAWAGEVSESQPESIRESADNSEDNQGSTAGSRKQVRARPTFPSTISNPNPDATNASESESSSTSSSTVTATTPANQDSPKKIPNKQRKSTATRPNALSFLDSDSPRITDDDIKRSMQEASLQSPSSSKGISPTSSASSSFQDDASDHFGDHETDRSTSPERSVDGDHINRFPARLDPHGDEHGKAQRNYGTPEMPRGNVQHPHISPDALTPRAPNQNHVKHLPRAEKLPLTGYELLASRLSATSPDQSGPRLRPMYRKFEALNHRLLLHLQDEICELEEQLHRLDTADTQNRRLRNAILPASRRAEYMSGGELQWHKTDILGKIGFKMEQYNHVLSSFRKTQSLPTPTLADIHEYRGYLASHSPIAEAETRFLDATDDLVCMGDDDAEEMLTEDEETIATPIPCPDFTFPSPKNENAPKTPLESLQSYEEHGSAPDKDPASAKPPIVPLSLALAVAVILPILTFIVIPGYLGRMTVVFLVEFGVLGGLIQGHVIGLNATRDVCICAVVYGAVMAIVAGAVS